MNERYETIIGLEIHIQLKTASKMFSSAPNVLGEAPANTAVDPVVLGHPGSMPSMNGAAIEQAIRLALALNCRIASTTRFDRKNYFYPDLPKGYQISQYDLPLASGGWVEVHVVRETKRFHLERLHVEEDAGKNMHAGDRTLVDFNRAGVPLAEIVTKPDFRSPTEARAFLQELRLIARSCGVSDADMEKGQLRCDANISLRPNGDVKLYPKTEVKNMNSFRSVERALLHEEKRQADLWDLGEPPTGQETRGWDEAGGVTRSQRTKEGSDDYRYLPEPDIPPLEITEDDVARLRESLPELPQNKRQRFIEEYHLNYQEADVLVQRPDGSDYFESVASEIDSWLRASGGAPSVEEIKRMLKYAHSWITSELLKHVNADGALIDAARITPENFAELVVMIAQGKVGSSAGQTILEQMYRSGGDPSDIAEELNLVQVDDEGALGEIIRAVIEEFPDQAAQYKAGKDAVVQFLVGQAMKRSGGKANPSVLAQLFSKALRGNE